jgi:hypothetical protein
VSTDVDVAAAAFVGFVYGFIGLPLVYFLVKRIVEMFQTFWPAGLKISGFFAAFAAFCFLIMVEYGSAGMWLDWFARQDQARRVQLGKIWVLWQFLGLAAFIAVPRLESELRKRSSRRRR